MVCKIRPRRTLEPHRRRICQGVDQFLSRDWKTFAVVDLIIANDWCGRPLGLWKGKKTENEKQLLGFAGPTVN